MKKRAQRMNLERMPKTIDAGVTGETHAESAHLKGLIARSTELTDEGLLRLILRPGFSTSETITAVSVRGVGKDVVNRQMETNAGTIEIETVLKKFTRFLLKIPITLAIIFDLENLIC